MFPITSTSAAGQGVDEEVAGGEAEAVAQPERGDVVGEDRPERRQVEAAAGEVVVGQGELHRQVPLRRADVDERCGTSPRGICAPAPAPCPC